MQTTAARIFAALDTAHTTDSQAAAALKMSRQAYSLARQRASLSDAVCIRAARLLALDPAETLLRLQIDRADPETRATWEDILNRITKTPESGDKGQNGTPQNDRPNPTNSTADDSGQTFHNPGCNTNYATFESTHKGNIHGMHLFKTRRIEKAERLVKWMLCVPRISPTSPRFTYYADNWNVMEKIRRFTANGEFDSIVENCPAFSAEELRAALDYIDRSDATEKPCNTTATTLHRQTTNAA